MMPRHAFERPLRIRFAHCDLDTHRAIDIPGDLRAAIDRFTTKALP